MDEIKFADIWNTLSKIDCSGHTEKKKTGGNRELTYLSWTWAWAEVMKHYPQATYSIREWDDKPWLDDPVAGVLVMTEVNIGGNFRKMWLPAMDGANNALKREPYAYTVKGYNGQPIEKKVAAVDMMAINKAIMRCLVKNLAMFGLGLNIYAGEDLPVGADDDPGAKPNVPKAQQPGNPAKPSAESLAKPVNQIAKKQSRATSNPRAAAAWKEFKTLDQVKDLSEDDRRKSWENLLMTATGISSAAQIKDDALWDKVDNEIGIMKCM